jgi:hypothetical protein
MISINENESWYLDESMKKSANAKSANAKSADHQASPTQETDSGAGMNAGLPDPNIRHSINGYMFGNMPMMTNEEGAARALVSCNAW